VTVRLTVDEDAWHRHVRDVAGSVRGLVPVVKGNGYGFGRERLARLAAELADTLAVGTIHELDGLPAGVTAVVLTPTLIPPDRRDVVLTVGAPEHVRALDGWGGRVLAKIESSMHRYGGAPTLVDQARSAGLDVLGYSFHAPLAGTDDEHVTEISEMLTGLDPDLEVWLSHVSPDAYRTLPGSHRYRLRLGTALWHGQRSTLHLEADVLQVRRARAGDRAGYRLQPIAEDSTLVMIGAGTANGVQSLADGRSPFHHGRRRLALLEAPHMHTSMAVVPVGEPCPQVGEWVDVQRPLTTTAIDVLRWR
jgi:alanine racemase